MTDKPIRLRISGGPLTKDMRVVDDETGRPIEGVRAFEIRAVAADLVEVKLDLILVTVDGLVVETTLQSKAT